MVRDLTYKYIVGTVTKPQFIETVLSVIMHLIKILCKMGIRVLHPNVVFL